VPSGDWREHSNVGGFAVILVHSAGHAVQAERVLVRAGLQVKLIPTPRQLSSDCGAALRIPAADRQSSQEVLLEAGVDIDRVEVLTE